MLVEPGRDVLHPPGKAGSVVRFVETSSVNLDVFIQRFDLIEKPTAILYQANFICVSRYSVLQRVVIE
jgi:hypothetical protein